MTLGQKLNMEPPQYESQYKALNCNT